MYKFWLCLLTTIRFEVVYGLYVFDGLYVVHKTYLIQIKEL